MRIKSCLVLFFIALFSTFTGTDLSWALDPKIEKLTQITLPEIKSPQINIKTLPNGIKIYYLQDGELPLFKVKLFFETGAVYETKEQRGLSEFFMAAWATGGSKDMSPDVVDQELEFISAKVMGATQEDLSSMTLMCLEKDQKKAFDIFFNLIRTPRFDEARIDVIKKGALEGIKRRNEEPTDILNREFIQALYGKDSVYAWMPTPETINPVYQQGLFKYYEDNIAPNRMLMAASSPLDFKEFLSLIEPYLADWQKKLPNKKYPPELTKDWRTFTGFIQKAGNQSSVALGHFGERRFNKDKFKLILANEVLGGSTFGSKLGDRLRTELGLVYSIRSSFGFNRDFGAFFIFTQTKSESTLTTINEIKRIFSDMVLQQNITAEELEQARERIVNRLVFEYESPFNIVTTRVIYDYNGYPPDYLSIYQREINEVKLKDVKEALARYFFPDRLMGVIVGDREKIPGLDQIPGFQEIPLDNE